MGHDILLLIIGLTLILAGGTMVTDGATAIARKSGISPLVIGLTVVAMGSSTPDLVVTLISTLKHHSELAVGNVIGANLFDLLLVTGVIALISPFSLKTDTRRFDVPMLFMSALTLFIMGDDRIVDNASINILNRSDGLMLLIFFAFFMWRTLEIAFGQNKTLAATASSTKPVQATTGSSTSVPSGKGISGTLTSLKQRYPMVIAVLSIVTGLAALIFGGNWMVDSASAIALKAGMSEGLVGLTIVGIGNAVPDLATSAIAALRKQPGLAFGNIVGACIINVFMILGLCAVIYPLPAGSINYVDFGTLVLAAFLLLLFGSILKKHTFTRGMGVLLCMLYVAYIAYLIRTKY